MTRIVGYWREGLKGVHPRRLVDTNWRHDERLQIGAYLRSGRTFETFLGYASCRFRCGIADEELGNADLTDGVWVWPEGLAHYVERHDVVIPDELVEHAAANNWVIPAETPTRPTDETEWDEDFWWSWCRRRARPLWRFWGPAR